MEQEIMNSNEYTSETMKKAAYALNLCTVSVSQIIDYRDLIVLEQEYDAILNNLNLEQFPKDEALLNILKQLLDTITFFRIQEGERKIIDKEYQHKIKNAIWSSVPNFGMLITGGDPWTIAFSLVSQVGIGYMNYRRSKAESDWEHEKQEWQLQRSALEQFNGLRRELFDTAWRLAAEYKFPDSYRLTERQIIQYNEILMDSDELRRFERLHAIKDCFIAYPPFWYYLGNSANLIAQKAKEDNKELYERFNYYAKEYFEKFLDDSKYGLLREDILVASCALEYIELLDPIKDLNKIRDLLILALDTCGNANDIMELSAMSYLKIGDRTSASKLLLRLINEDYNKTVNSQILSSIYACEYVIDNSRENRNNIKYNYSLLESRINSSQYLCPLPEDNAGDITECQNEFVEKQKIILLEKYKEVLLSLCNKHALIFSKALPVPDERKQYEDRYYESSEGKKSERLNDLQLVFANEMRKQEYISRLQDVNLAEIMLNELNAVMQGFWDFECIDYEDEEIIANCITNNLLQKKDFINSIQSKISTRNIELPDLKKIIVDLDFLDFIQGGVKEAYSSISSWIYELSSIKDVNLEEINLRNFCRMHGLEEPDILYDRAKLPQKHESEKKSFFSMSILGKDAVAEHREAMKVKEMLSKIKNAKDSIVIDTTRFAVFIKGSNEYNAYISKHKLDASRTEVLAIITCDKFGFTFNNKDLLLCESGIRQARLKNIVRYDLVVKGANNSKIFLGADLYENKCLNMNELYTLCQTLSQYSKKYDSYSSGSRLAGVLIEPAWIKKKKFGLIK